MSREADGIAGAIEKLLAAHRMGTIREWLLGSMHGTVAIKVRLRTGQDFFASGADVSAAVDALIVKLAQATEGKG